MTYPINHWAYISPRQIDYLLNTLDGSAFNTDAVIGLSDQVYNYLNYLWLYIKENEWLLFNEDKTRVAFNIRLKPRIELGDDYIFAVFGKNDNPGKQEWKLICFVIRGTNSLKFANVEIDIDLYSDRSAPFPSIVIPNEFTLSFGFNHLFIEDDRHPICRAKGRIPNEILNLFSEWDTTSKRMLCSLIKFSILNDHEGVSRYLQTDENIKLVTTSFNTDKFLRIINFDDDCRVAKKERILNELPYSYLYPVCIRRFDIPDFAIVFRKKGKGRYTQFIGKTILKLSDAQMSARVCNPVLKDTWLSNENANR